MSETSELLRRDRAHVWHPYTQHAIAIDSLPIARASGATLHTTDGATLIDAISSWWVTLHGHAEPSIAKAIADQAMTLEHVIFAGCTHEPAVRLAEELARVAPKGLTRAFYSDDGSTAVEVALKMTLQRFQHRGQKRTVIAAFENAYHGDTFGAMSVSARGVFTEPFGELLFEVARLPDPTGGDVVAAFDALLETRGGEVAALIVEPLLMGAGGMKMYPAEVLSALAASAKRAGVLLIADEVATGFGRTGPLFACQRAGVSPDLMCLSKGVTGGFLPLGVTLTTEEIFGDFLSEDRRRTFFHGHSYTGNPLACAAAIASLQLLVNPACTEARARIERQHTDALSTLRQSRRVTNTRVLGTVAAFDFVVGEGYLAPIGRELAAFARQRGVLLRPLGNVVYVMPPYRITEAELQRVWSTISEFVATLS